MVRGQKSVQDPQNPWTDWRTIYLDILCVKDSSLVLCLSDESRLRLRPAV